MFIVTFSNFPTTSGIPDLLEEESQNSCKKNRQVKPLTLSRCQETWTLDMVNEGVHHVVLGLWAGICQYLINLKLLNKESWNTEFKHSWVSQNYKNMCPYNKNKTSLKL
jgi:hypothetical protein